MRLPSHVCVVCACVRVRVRVSEGLQDQMTGNDLSNEQALTLLKEVCETAVLVVRGS